MGTTFFTWQDKYCFADFANISLKWITNVPIFGEFESLFKKLETFYVAKLYFFLVENLYQNAL